VNGFLRTAIERSNHLAVVCETEELTYRELDERSSALATVIADAGVHAGDRIALMLPNCIEFIEASAASAKLGVAVLTINWHLRPEELAWILADSSPTALVAHQDFEAIVKQSASADLPVIWVGGDYEPRLRHAAETHPVVDYQWPTSWPVIYTSGTSGRPKGVIHPALAVPETMEMAQDGLIALWGYSETDVHLVAGPLYHAGPAGYCNTTLYCGATVVLMDRWDPREFLRLVQTHRVTTTFLTPAHFIRLLEIPAEEFAAFDLSSLRHVLHAGAPCASAIKERIIGALPHAEIWELYGMSEGGATRVSAEEWLQRPGTVGLPWPGVDVRILDPETREPLPIGVDGLIYVKPPYGRFRYHNDDAKTADAWHDDAFTVGDIGHLDSDGYLYLTDRLVDMVIRAGVNIYPREVEEVLHRHPAVVDCAVFGVPDDRDGERLKAVIETRSPTTTKDLESWCTEHLDHFKVPSTFELCDALPRDPNGKVLKRLLRDPEWETAGRVI